MAAPETNTRKVAARLKRESWKRNGGGGHDKYVHPDRPGIMIMVPRHHTLSPGVARAIAKLAGWS